MPLMQIFTSLSRSQVPENLAQLAAKALSNTMRNKPLERICVHVNTDQMIFSGKKMQLEFDDIFSSKTELIFGH